MGGQQALYQLDFNPKPVLAFPVRITPEIRQALIQAQADGQPCTVRFGDPGSSSAIAIGSREFNFTYVKDNNCELLKIPSEFREPGSCEEIGHVQHKLQIQRTLDENQSNKLKLRTEEADKKLKERKAIQISDADARKKKEVKETRTLKSRHTPPPTLHTVSTGSRPPVPRPGGTSKPSTGPQRPGSFAPVRTTAPPRQTPPAWQPKPLKPGANGNITDANAQSAKPPVVSGANAQSAKPPVASGGLAATVHQPRGALTPPPGKERPPVRPLQITDQMVAAAKSNDLKRLLSFILRDRPLSQQGLNSAVSKVKDQVREFRIPKSHQLQEALNRVAELMHPGKYVLRPEVLRHLDAEASARSQSPSDDLAGPSPRAGQQPSSGSDKDSGSDGNKKPRRQPNARREPTPPNWQTSRQWNQGSSATRNAHDSNQRQYPPELPRAERHPNRRDTNAPTFPHPRSITPPPPCYGSARPTNPPLRPRSSSYQDLKQAYCDGLSESPAAETKFNGQRLKRVRDWKSDAEDDLDESGRLGRNTQKYSRIDTSDKAPRLAAASSGFRHNGVRHPGDNYMQPANGSADANKAGVHTVTLPNEPVNPRGGLTNGLTAKPPMAAAPADKRTGNFQGPSSKIGRGSEAPGSMPLEDVEPGEHIQQQGMLETTTAPATIADWDSSSDSDEEYKQYLNRDSALKESIKSTEQFLMYKVDFEKKYSTYERLHKKIQKNRKDFAALERSAQAAPTEKERDRLYMQCQLLWDKRGERSRNWNTAFRVLHKELESTKERMKEFVDKVHRTKQMQNSFMNR